MPIRWGIIGCGDVVRKRVARAIIDEPNSELLAVCRRNTPALKEFCERFEVPRSYGSDVELIGDDDLDAIYIATPVSDHHAQTIAAAHAGKHVVVEKPMAMSVQQCDEMIEACQANDVRLSVAYYRRFYPVVERIDLALRRREIGAPLSVTAVTSTPFGFAPHEDGYWRVELERGGGGALMDIGSHRLNLMIHWFGAATDVKALCDTRANGYDAEDCVSLVCRFESGVHGIVHCLFGAAVDPDSLTLIGTKGHIQCQTLNEGRFTLCTTGGRSDEHLPPNANFNSPLIQDFVSAIAGNCSPRVTGQEGRKTNDLMQRGYGDAGVGSVV